MHRRLLLLALPAILGIAGADVAAADSGSPEARFVELINAERRERGLGTLARRSDLDAVAERHAERMRKRGEIYHNSNLGNEIGGSWRGAGENVGVGFDTDGLHAAFMGSPGHRANILAAAFDEVGLGVVVDPSGEVYVTEVFVDRGGSSSSKKPTAKRPSEPKPSTTPVTRRPPAKPEPRASTPATPLPMRSTPPASSAPAAPATTQTTPPSETAEDAVDRDRAVDLLLRIVSSS